MLRTARRAVRRRRWLLQFSREHVPALASHAATPGAARKIRLLGLVLPLTSGLRPRLKVRISLIEGEFLISDISELLVLYEVFAGDAYPATALPPSAATIVDAGANIGATVRFFRSHYPDARIVALEPDPDACELCRRNGSPDPNLDVRRMALTADGGEITLMRTRGESWATSALGEGSAFSAPATTLDALVAELGRIDLLKLDIEGSEWEVLRQSKSLDMVTWLVGELHATQGTKADFLALVGAEFEILYDGVAADGGGTFAARRRSQQSSPAS